MAGPRHNKPVSCYDQACRLLARRAHSKAELAAKLSARGHGAESVRETVAKLAELGYLDDAAYCADYAKGRVARRGVGPAKLRAELTRKGFDMELVDRALETHFGGEDDERAAAFAAAARKAFGFGAMDDSETMKHKLYTFLTRRGFSSTTARVVALDDFARVMKEARR
ncbi:MAG: regulatory protein RecX [Nitrospinae bacterium]|nr:regulatory protein RecX [Nitrospinota bacterium]